MSALPPPAPPSTLCKSCEARKPPERTHMVQRPDGRAAFCPRCDRRKCNRLVTPSDPTSVCGTVLIDGDEKRCPVCGADVRLQTPSPT